MTKKRKSEGQVDNSIETLLQATNEAAKQFVYRFIPFSAVSAYFIFLLLASVDDEKLLKGSLLPLLFLDIELPIDLFFVFAPALYLILYTYIILKLRFLSDKLGSLVQRCGKHSIQNKKLQTVAELIEPNPFCHHFLAIEKRLQIRILNYLFVLGIVLVIPLFGLLLLQYKFLPYHSLWSTYLHRFFILTALIILLLCRPLTLSKKKNASRRSFSFGICMTMAITIIFSSVFVLTLPGEPTDLITTRWNALGNLIHRNLFLHYLDKTKLVAEEPPSNIIATYIKKGEDKDKAWLSYAKGLDLQKRDLRYAIFIGLELFKANMQGADLREATFLNTSFKHANLAKAKMKGANFRQVCFEDAILVNAILPGVDLRRENLIGAKMNHANMLGANLFKADLRGAVLCGVNGQAADFYDSKLNFADMFGAKLQGANLAMAHLGGAVLQGAQLQGANFSGAKLKGTILYKAKLGGAVFEDAFINLCDLSFADFAPLKLSYWQKLCDTIEKELPEGTRKRRALGFIEKAKNRKPKWEVSVFTEFRNNFCSGDECNGIKAPAIMGIKMKGDYNKKFINFMFEQICKNETIAKYCGERILRAEQRFFWMDFFTPLILNSPFPTASHRLYNLAKRILEEIKSKECNSLKLIPPDVVEHLRNFVNEHNLMFESRKKRQHKPLMNRK